MSAVLDVTSTPPIPFGRLVRVELRKTYDTRAGFWLLALIAGLVLVAEIIILAVTASRGDDVAFGDFVGAAAFVTSILLPVLGILLVTSEWGQRTAMVTFALEPRRPHVILAKLATGIALTFLTAAFAIAVGFVCNVVSFLLQGEGSWEFGWNYFFGFLLVQSMAMLGGFALATLLLSTPAALVVFFVYKWALPGLLAAGAVLMDWFEDIEPYLNLLKAQSPLADLSLDTGTEWAHLLVASTVWVVLPLVVGMQRILRAEVK